MDTQMKFSLFVLFVLNGLISTHVTIASPTHDITPYLGKWITEMFDEDLSTTAINSLVRSAFASAKYHRVEEFEYNVTEEIEPFQSKFYFHDINFYTHTEDADRTEPFHLSSWSSNNIVVKTKFLRITLEGELRAEKDKPYASYFTTLHFHDFVLSATRTSNQSDVAKFSYDISYRKYYAKHHEYEEDIKWTAEDLSGDLDTLTEQIEPLLPILLREHINRNPKFSTAIEGIILVHPGFFNDEHTHYYLIPKIPFFDFNLRKVVVQGFSNIERFDIRDEDDDDMFSRTLLFRNLSGSLTLDYETAHETTMPLSYSLDYLSISVMKSDFVHVEATSYCVNRTNDGEPLGYRQSANIMQKIEFGLVSALFPNKKAWKTIDMESKIGPMNVEDKEWKTIRSTYSDWIPFNNDFYS